MLTPGYPLTATERVLPGLFLDFTSASLDSRVSLTRALNTATRINASGYLETVNADLPRFDYTLNTGGVCKGLLIEDTKQNICLYSTDLTGASWNSFGGETSVTASSGISIDGTNNAFKVTGVSGLGRLGQTMTVSPSTTYTFSFFAKNIDATVCAYLDTATGQSVNYVSQINTSTWTRLSRTVTTGAAQTSLIVQFVRDIPAGQSVLICFPQVEANSYASSVILTSATAVTRNADVAVMTGTNFSAWWVSTVGAAAIRATSATVAGTTPSIQFDDTTANNIIVLRGNTTNPELYVKATTDQAQIDAGTIAANTLYGLAGAWNTNDCAAAVSGAAAVTDTSVTVPTATQARLGSDGTNYLNGWLQTVRYWPQRLTNAEIQAFSKL